MENNELHLHYQQPANTWTEALPLGNGKMGAMVFGDVTREIIGLNEDTLWSGLPDNMQNSHSPRYLSIVRKLIDEENYIEAKRIVDQRMLGHKVQAYLAMANLMIDFTYPQDCKMYEYTRTLTLSDAITYSDYKIGNVGYHREAFISYPDNALVIKFTASESGAINFTAKFTSQNVYKTICELESAYSIYKIKGIAPTQSDLRYEGDTKELLVFDDIDTSESTHFETWLYPTCKGGNIYVSNGEIKIENADEVTFYIISDTSFVAFDKIPNKDMYPFLSTTFNNLVAKGYENIKSTHIDDFNNLFNRVELYLGETASKDLPTDERLNLFRSDSSDNSLITLLYQYGRYLFISCSRKGSFPANLQGIWNWEIRPPWNSNLTTNINTEMNYWIAENSNLSECHYPLLDMLKDLRKSGSVTAREHFNCRGFTAAHNVDIWLYSAPAEGNAVHSFWPMGGAWLSTHIWEHYLFTLDKDFLKEYYDILHDAALFCYDWLYEDKQSGYLVTSPATSPENTFIFDRKNNLSSCVSKASTCDMGIIREIFSDVIKASEVLDCDDEFRLQLQEAYKKLFPYQIGRNGRLQEWYKDFYDAEPGHRHVSHLFGAYPGTHITQKNMPTEYEGVRKALLQRLENGGGHTGWSCGWVINLFARLEDKNLAYRFVRQMLTKSSYPNLFDAHPPFQIDGNFGGAAGIAEMLVQSHADCIKLLPALPDEWATGYVKGLKCRGNITVDIKWEAGKLTEATMSSPSEITVKVVYSDMEKLITLKDDAITLGF